MTKHEKRSLQYRLARRFEEDPRRIMEIIREEIKKTPLTEERPKGEWIYDKNINNWRCSICGQTPPPTGYVGKADFMATHFNFCPNCGADMRGDKAE